MESQIWRAMVHRQVSLRRLVVVPSITNPTRPRTLSSVYHHHSTIQTSCRAGSSSVLRLRLRVDKFWLVVDASEAVEDFWFWFRLWLWFCLVMVEFEVSLAIFLRSGGFGGGWRSIWRWFADRGFWSFRHGIRTGVLAGAHSSVRCVGEVVDAQASKRAGVCVSLQCGHAAWAPRCDARQLRGTGISSFRFPPHVIWILIAGGHVAGPFFAPRCLFGWIWAPVSTENCSQVLFPILNPNPCFGTLSSSKSNVALPPRKLDSKHRHSCFTGLLWSHSYSRK